MDVKWGKDGIPSSTTSKNLSNREKNGLLIHELPRTFRDAVRITRLLGYKYLWIDSLCIVQGDSKDWESEAAKMASIFRCADLVLCAASANNSTEGCGIDDILEPASSFLFPSVSYPESNPPAQANHASKTRLLIRRSSGASSGLTSWPTQRRGWIFQEILLARRVLYFVNGHMIWQCHHTLQSEDGVFTEAQAARRSGSEILSSATLFDLNPSSIDMDVRGWWRILGDHFGRRFTNPEDTLPSLAGLIDIWQRCTSDEPVLGLWKKDLPFHMCWFATDPILNRVSGQPSWCWTSVPQRWRPILRHASTNYVEVEDVVWQTAIKAIDVQWEGRPFVSRVRHTRLSLSRVRVTRGAFYQAVIYVLDNEEEKQFKRPEAVEILPLVIAKPSNSKTKQLGRPPRFHLHSLLLERINLANGRAKYRRKGYANFLSSPDYSDSDVDKRVEEIVGGIEDIDIIEIV